MSRLLVAAALVACVMLAGTAIIQAQDAGAPPADAGAGKGKGKGKGQGGAMGAGGPGGGMRGAVELNPDQQKVVDEALPALKTAIAAFQAAVAKAPGLDEATARRVAMQAVMQALRPADGTAGPAKKKAPDASAAPAGN
jgi:hypothetical protein